jgi:hypothetical protein
MTINTNWVDEKKTVEWQGQTDEHGESIVQDQVARFVTFEGQLGVGFGC